MAGNGAILAGVLFVVIVTFLGYTLAGKSDKDNLKEVGALATGQRNTAASMLIAANNFPQFPEVFLIITVVNMLGMILHFGLARLMSKDVISDIGNGG